MIRPTITTNQIFTGAQAFAGVPAHQGPMGGYVARPDSAFVRSAIVVPALATGRQSAVEAKRFRHDAQAYLAMPSGGTGGTSGSDSVGAPPAGGSGGDDGDDGDGRVDDRFKRVFGLIQDLACYHRGERRYEEIKGALMESVDYIKENFPAMVKISRTDSGAEVGYDGSVSDEGLEALHFIFAEDDMPTALRLMEHSDTYYRYAGVLMTRCIGWNGDATAAVPKLLELFGSDKDEDAMYQIKWTLEEMGASDERTIDALHRVAREERSYELGELAVELLVKIGYPAVRALPQIYKFDNDSVDMFVRQFRKEELPLLQAWAKEEGNEYRETVVRVLGESTAVAEGRAEFVPLLMEILKGYDKFDEFIVFLAIVASGNVGAAAMATIPHILKVAGESEVDALKAVGKILEDAGDSWMKVIERVGGTPVTHGESAEGNARADAVDAAEATLQRRLIARALTETGRNVARAARMLKISEEKLREKMQELGLRDE